MGQGYIDVPLTPRQRPQAAPAVNVQGYEDVPLQPSHSAAGRPYVAPYWGVPRPVSDMNEGAAAGLMSTGFHGGDLLRRGWNALAPDALQVQRPIETPDAQAAMTPPNTAAGKVGFYGEQAAEFANPLRATSGVFKGAPMFQRALADAGASAAIAGVQSGGDPVSMGTAGVGAAVLPFAGAAAGAVGRTAQRAAAGAQESGLGGAIASAVRTVAPGEPRTLLIQALKPRNVKTNFPGALDRALPELKAAEQAIGRPIAGVDDLLEATKAAKGRLQQQLGILRGGVQGFEVDLTPVAEAMVKSIPKKLQLENPAAALRMKEAAAAYRGRFGLEDAETILRETNAELNSLYSMLPQGRHAALTANPGAASLDAQAKALRDAIYSTLDAPGGGAAARELQRRYGSLMEIEGEAFRRSNVAARQQPESLSEQIGAVRAAADMARGAWRLAHFDAAGAADIAAGYAGRSTAKAIKDSQTTDALIRRAFQGFKGAPADVAMPTRRPVAGLLERGPLVTPPPADASFVRGVPAMPSHASRPALPPARPTTHMPSGERSGGGSIRARETMQRDPRTGQWRKVYVAD